MPTAQKVEVVEKTKEKYAKSEGVLFTEYRGLSVTQMQTLRAELKEKGGELQVVKNTLFKLAAGDDAEKFPEDATSGPTAVAFIYENESECAKVLVDFSKKNKSLVVKGGLVSGSYMDADGVIALSDLPPRDVLIAQVIGTIVAPLTSLIGTVEALYATPIRTIGAVADKAAEEGGLSEAEASTEETPAEEAKEAQAEQSESEAKAEEPAPAEESADAPTEETENKE